MTVSEMAQVIPPYAWLYIASVPIVVLSMMFGVIRKTGFPTEMTAMKISAIVVFFGSVLVGVFYSFEFSGCLLFVACALSAIENVTYSLKNKSRD